jgi:hypothetical protein
MTGTDNRAQHREQQGAATDGSGRVRLWRDEKDDLPRDEGSEHPNGLNSGELKTAGDGRRGLRKEAPPGFEPGVTVLQTVYGAT